MRGSNRVTNNIIINTTIAREINKNNLRRDICLYDSFRWYISPIWSSRSGLRWWPLPASQRAPASLSSYRPQSRVRCTPASNWDFMCSASYVCSAIAEAVGNAGLAGRMRVTGTEKHAGAGYSRPIEKSRRHGVRAGGRRGWLRARLDRSRGVADAGANLPWRGWRNQGGLPSQWLSAVRPTHGRPPRGRDPLHAPFRPVSPATSLRAPTRPPFARRRVSIWGGVAVVPGRASPCFISSGSPSLPAGRKHPHFNSQLVSRTCVVHMSRPVPYRSRIRDALYTTVSTSLLADVF